MFKVIIDKFARTFHLGGQLEVERVLCDFRTDEDFSEYLRSGCMRPSNLPRDFIFVLFRLGNRRNAQVRVKFLWTLPSFNEENVMVEFRLVETLYKGGDHDFPANGVAYSIGLDQQAKRKNED